MTHAPLTYFSTFSGIGGFEAAVHAVEPQAICAGYSEIDKYADQIYRRHFPAHVNFGDIETIDPASLPDFDLMFGGFPCQAFSIAGKRAGFADCRGTLFFEVARLLGQKQPRLLLLENVKGLLSHNQGRTFLNIICTLDELGYDLEWQVLDSQNFGVPQHRERVFIVGHLRATPRPKVFPFTGSSNETETSHHEIHPIIDANYCNGYSNQRRAIQQLNQPKHSNDRIYGKNGISPTLNTAQGGNRQPFILDVKKIRKLTPTEYERLQGFPDGWTDGISDAQRYKCLGNAITVPVVTAVMKRLLG